MKAPRASVLTMVDPVADRARAHLAARPARTDQAFVRRLPRALSPQLHRPECAQSRAGGKSDAGRGALAGGGVLRLHDPGWRAGVRYLFGVRRDRPSLPFPLPGVCRLGACGGAARVARPRAAPAERAQKDKKFTHAFSPHCLRHTFAIQHINVGTDVKLISKWLGHESVAVTLQHYGNWIKETQRLAEDVSRDANAKMMAKITAIRNQTKTERTKSSATPRGTL